MKSVRKIAVTIGRPAAEAYEFLSQPENFPKWASGLGRALRQVEGEWIADTEHGPARVRFSEPNAFGVLDHAVTLPQGRSVYVPLRVVAKGAGCELELTLFRQLDASDAQFAADAEWVKRDLDAAKRLLEI